MNGTRLALLEDVRETSARVYYRWLMGEFYDEFPWDDKNKPSNETQEEAEKFADDVVRQLLLLT